MEEDLPELSDVLQALVAAGVPVQKDKITAVAECALRHVNKYKKAVYLIERWVRHVDPQFRSAGICIIDKLCHEAKKKLKDGNVFVPRFRLRINDTVEAVRVVRSTGQRDLMNRIFNAWRERKWFDIPPLPATFEEDAVGVAAAAAAASSSSSSGRGSKRSKPSSSSSAAPKKGTAAPPTSGLRSPTASPSNTPPGSPPPLPPAESSLPPAAVAPTAKPVDPRKRARAAAAAHASPPAAPPQAPAAAPPSGPPMDPRRARAAVAAAAAAAQQDTSAPAPPAPLAGANPFGLDLGEDEDEEDEALPLPGLSAPPPATTAPIPSPRPATTAASVPSPVPAAAPERDSKERERERASSRGALSAAAARARPQEPAYPTAAVAATQALAMGPAAAYEPPAPEGKAERKAQAVLASFLQDFAEGGTPHGHWPDALVPTADHRTMAAAALPPLSAQAPLFAPPPSTPHSLLSAVPGLYLEHRQVAADVTPAASPVQGGGEANGAGGAAAAATGGVQRRAWGRRGVVG